jgi:hypothetical protein
MKSCLLLIAIGVAIAAPAGLDPRLTVHTLVREDIFAGFLSNDMERLVRAEKNLELLLQDRPQLKHHIRAWQGGAALYRAVLAYEQKQKEAFELHYHRALDCFSEAERLAPQDSAVAAITGGSYSVFADRLPDDLRAAAWNKAYQAYRVLWRTQEPALEKLPLHMKGELLAGLTQTAQRTGHADEAALYLDKMLVVLAETPYATRAKKWKENPLLAGRSSVTCQTCHDAGRLEARTAELK